MATPPTKTASTGSNPTQLQRKIFTRWANQKLIKKNITVKDIVDEIGTGIILVALLETLAEKTCTSKIDKNPKAKPQKIDNCSQALKFVWECGVEMKLKPSAEQLVDGGEQAILGLIWAIMMKYVKIGDDDGEQQLSAKDALLLWASNKVSEYKEIPKVEKFGKEWHDGVIFCALLHKHRPQMIDYGKVNKENKIENLKLSQDVALKYFGLEKYVTPEEIQKLDENSMFVYVSEYYYGIAEQRKLDLAAKRISKVIKLTKENDAMRKEYNETAQKFKERVSRVEKVLEDRTIDNTMAGAKKRIAEFYDYKTKDKNVLLQNQLDLEALYNNLAMRLAHHKRPEFIPPSGLTLKDIAKTVLHLEECEQERKVALHAELNRQIKLVQLDEQHKARFQRLKTWFADKAAYLKTRETILSVSAAELQLRLLEAYGKEFQNVNDTSLDQLKKLTAELAREKYERTAEAQTREKEIIANFEELKGFAKEKKPFLDDALAREQFKDKVRGMNQEHTNQYTEIQNWSNEKEKYLKHKESINSVPEARTQISRLESFEKEKKRTSEVNVAQLKALGKDIIAQEYKTQYSQWKFENPQEIHDREADLDAKFSQLAQLSVEKRKVLDADLAREVEKERLRMEFARLATEFTRWTKESAEDLKVSSFGFTLEEVEAHQAVLKADNDRINKEAGDKQNEAKGVLDKMHQMGANDNPYTTLTLDDLSKSKTTLQGEMDKRNKAFETELARQRANDALCKEFANLADPFVKSITDVKDQITSSKADLEEQLKFVQSKIKTLDADSSKLKPIKDTFAKMEAAGITNNKYTTLTDKDAEVQWEQYKSFLSKKVKMLEEEIEHHKLRGVTQEQFNEIESTFKQFDADKSGKIDKRELKACLYSLGEEKNKAEIEAIMKKYSKDGKGIVYDAFREFMIDLLGVSDTKDDILNSFKLINKGDDAADEEKMSNVMLKEDIQYIKDTAKKAGTGYNYTSWTEDVFSR